MRPGLLAAILATTAHSGAARALGGRRAAPPATSGAPAPSGAPGADPQTRRLACWAHAHREELVHLAITLHCMQGSYESVRTDQWKALRDDPPERGGIRSRRRRAAQVGQLLGAGYTPRITFLAGLMLRSLQMCTQLRRVFDPSLGYAAGACLGASFSHREWIPCILLGWGVGGTYWSLFRVRPPGVGSVPFVFH